MCKCSAELTHGKNSCELLLPVMQDELWEYLWGKGIWHLFLWQNILYAFPNSRLTANLMSSHFWDVGSLPGIFRFQLRNKPTVCYVLRYHMWHIALLEAHCAAWASYSFPNGAGKGQWVFNTHQSCSSCLPQWRKGGVEKHESARFLCDKGWSPLPVKLLKIAYLPSACLQELESNMQILYHFVL